MATASRPSLPAEIRSPCPAQKPLTDGSPAGVAADAVGGAAEYRRCQARHQAAVGAFDALAAAFDALVAKLTGEKPE